MGIPANGFPAGLLRACMATWKGRRHHEGSATRAERGFHGPPLMLTTSVHGSLQVSANGCCDGRFARVSLCAAVVANEGPRLGIGAQHRTSSNSFGFGYSTTGRCLDGYHSTTEPLDPSVPNVYDNTRTKRWQRQQWEWQARSKGLILSMQAIDGMIHTISSTGEHSSTAHHQRRSCERTPGWLGSNTVTHFLRLG